MSERRYEWGRHSSDLNHVHVAFVLGEDREDLFDVTLYSIETGNPADGAFIESLEALELLIARANAGLAAEPERTKQYYRVEFRIDVEAPDPGVAIAMARDRIEEAEVTAVFDEQFEEVDMDPGVIAS